MTRMISLELDEATGQAKTLLEMTTKQLGRTPNLYRSMAQSPIALEAYLAFRGVLVKGGLSVQLMEQIALLTAAVNDCDYCVAAHTLRGGKIGLSAEALQATQKAQSEHAKEFAALQFVEVLLDSKGKISDADFAKVSAVGWSNAEIGEMIGHVALNVFSNYFNHVAQPILDFPSVAVIR